MRTYSLLNRVRVAGGAGFLGSPLCERLLADGQDVLCVDNFFTGTKDNIAHLAGNPHFELMRHGNRGQTTVSGNLGNRGLSPISNVVAHRLRMGGGHEVGGPRCR